MVVTPTFEMSGSMLAGTAAHSLVSLETKLELEADLEPAVVASLVDQAERMCFVMDALARPHHVERTITLNGQPLAIPS